MNINQPNQKYELPAKLEYAKLSNLPIVNCEVVSINHYYMELRMPDGKKLRIFHNISLEWQNNLNILKEEKADQFIDAFVSSNSQVGVNYWIEGNQAPKLSVAVLKGERFNESQVRAELIALNRANSIRSGIAPKIVSVVRDNNGNILGYCKIELEGKEEYGVNSNDNFDIIEAVADLRGIGIEITRDSYGRQRVIVDGKNFQFPDLSI